MLDELIAFRVVEAHAAVRDILRARGCEEKVGRINRFTSLGHAIEVFRAEAESRS